MNASQTIATVRALTGLTQRELGERIGLATTSSGQATVSLWERGRARREHAKRVLDAFGVSELTAVFLSADPGVRKELLKIESFRSAICQDVLRLLGG